MARPKDVRLVPELDASKVIKGAEETNKALNSIEDNAKRIRKGGKKDWGGFVDIFSNLLPRGMQRTIRGFKSTIRSVGRLSKGFKVLKSAWAGIGIGLIIIGLEQIIENWDKITEALGFYNKEAEETKKLNKEIAKSQAELSSEMVGYLQIISDLEAEESLRQEAIKKINGQLGFYIDTEASANKQREQAIKLSALALEIDKQRNLQKEATEKFRIAELEYEENSTSAEKLQAYLDASAKVEKITRDALALEVELGELLLERTDSLKKQELAEKALAKIKADLARQAEADAQFLADLEKRLSEEVYLAKIEDEQLRAEEELKMRTQEQIMKALDAGATAEQMLLIEEKYKLDLLKLEERFKEQIDEIVKTPEQILEEQERLREDMRRAELIDDEILVQKAQDDFDAMFELANGHKELIEEAERLHTDALQKITDDASDRAREQRKKEADEQISLQIKKNNAILKASRSVLGGMMDLAEEGSEQMKALAIVDILISQGVAVANAITTATKFSKTPLDMAVNIAVAIGTVLSAFAQVKSLLAEADASGGGGSIGSGGGGGGATTPLVPQGLGRMDSPTGNQAYVVQSQLEGQALNAQQLRMQTVL